MHFSLVNELREAFVHLSYSDQQTFDAALPTFEKQMLRPRLQAVAAALRRAGGPFLQGAEVTFADVVWVCNLHDRQLVQFTRPNTSKTCPPPSQADLLEQLRTLSPKSMEDLPELAALQSAVEALPALKAYRASPRFIDRPYNNGMAAFK